MNWRFVILCQFLLLLQSNGERVSQGIYSTGIGLSNQSNSSSLSCKGSDTDCHPPNCSSSWVYSINGECNCGYIPNDLLRCNSAHGIAVLVCNCATYNETEMVLEAGQCIFNCGKGDDSLDTLLSLPSKLTLLDSSQCSSYNRGGTLCGRCREGYFSRVYSFDMDCVECLKSKSNWLKYAVAAYLPLTIFCFIILFFNVNITSSVLYGFVRLLLYQL